VERLLDDVLKNIECSRLTPQHRHKIVDLP